MFFLFVCCCYLTAQCVCACVRVCVCLQCFQFEVVNAEKAKKKKSYRNSGVAHLQAMKVTTRNPPLPRAPPSRRVPETQNAG